MRSKKTILSVLPVLLISSFTSCVDGQYGQYPNSGYGYPSNNYPPPNNYPGQYYPPNNGYGYPPPPPPVYPQYPRNQHPNWQQPTPPPPPPVAAPAPQEPIIRPSCPSGTVFDGKSCNITDNKLRRPGGDGRINPCPSGMHVSGDRCVR